MVVNVENLLKMVKNGDFLKFVKNGEMLKNVGESIKKIFALICFYTQDIKNIIFNPKFYQHFVPSLLMRLARRHAKSERFFSATSPGEQVVTHRHAQGPVL